MSELRLTRNELSKFLPDQRSVLAFERLLTQTTDAIPADIETIYRLIEDGGVEAAGAVSKANLALSELSRIANALDRVALSPPIKHPNQLGVDYIDFALSPPHSSVVGRLDWNSTDDTLNIHHSGGVIQQVGEEHYARCLNATGSTIANGTCVAYHGVTGGIIDIQKCIADGTITEFYLLGVATEDITNNAIGRVTVWGHVRDINTSGTPYGETWAVGDILYAHPTTAGGLTKVKPTAPNLCIPVAIVVVASATVGDLFVRPVIQMQQYFGSFSKTADATPAVINTAYPITFDTTRISEGVSIDGTTTSKIVVANSGLYSFAPSFQLTSTSASTKNVWLWFRKNGTDIATSAFKTSLDSATAVKTISRTMMFSLAANDYIELMWASDDTAVTLDAIAATAFAPSAPSCILEVMQEQP